MREGSPRNQAAPPTRLPYRRRPRPGTRRPIPRWLKRHTSASVLLPRVCWTHLDLLHAACGRRGSGAQRESPGRCHSSPGLDTNSPSASKIPRSGPETTWTDRIWGPGGRSWCRRCTRPPCTAAPLQSVINKAARCLKKKPKTSVLNPPGENHSSGGPGSLRTRC